MHATAQPVMVNANAKKGMYWAISSQATWEQAEGSTTRARSPDRTVKPHERGTCEDCRFVVISPLGLLKEAAEMEEFDGFKEWISEKYASHGLVGLVKAKGFAPSYRQLIGMLEEAGVEHGLDAVYNTGLGKHIEVIFEMACDGCTSSEIADALGAKTKTVTRFCSRHGIDLDRPTVLKDLHDALLVYVENGLSIPEIAAEIGFSATSLRRYFRANGIVVADQYHTGESTTETGYKLLYKPEHPDADSKGYIREHRFVMEQQIGRRLAANECVHHKNGDKLDNRLDNLELTTKAAHTGLHARNGECGWAVYHSKKI